MFYLEFLGLFLSKNFVGSFPDLQYSHPLVGNPVNHVYCLDLR